MTLTLAMLLGIMSDNFCQYREQGVDTVKAIALSLSHVQDQYGGSEDKFSSSGTLSSPSPSSPIARSQIMERCRSRHRRRVAWREALHRPRKVVCLHRAERAQVACR